MCKFDREYVGEVSKFIVANITGRCYGHLKNQPAGQSVLAINSRSEDCARRVRI